jgi:3-hydroxyisobutyrate dehydrogenase-like beta-hydroxyacid dehydrogenase
MSTTHHPRIGFVGFGEAGFHLAKGLRSAGAEHIAAFDIHAATPGRGELIRQRAAATQTALMASNEALANATDIVLSTVTANQAVQAAEQTTAFLTARHLYADLNSVSPVLKQTIAKVIEGGAGTFVEVAVMGPVPPSLHKVQLLIGGNGAESFAERMRPLGMQMEMIGPRVGTAAATKMCRSIIVKGMEALLTECVLIAKQYDADERVLLSLEKTFPGLDWKNLASYMVSRVAVHAERRAREMEEVAETVRSAGIDPIMAEATVRRMDWAAMLDLRSRFGEEGPATYHEFVDAVLELRLSTPNKNGGR